MLLLRYSATVLRSNLRQTPDLLALDRVLPAIIDSSRSHALDPRHGVSIRWYFLRIQRVGEDPTDAGFVQRGPERGKPEFLGRTDDQG